MEIENVSWGIWQSWNQINPKFRESQRYIAITFPIDHYRFVIRDTLVALYLGQIIVKLSFIKTNKTPQAIVTKLTQFFNNGILLGYGIYKFSSKDSSIRVNRRSSITISWTPIISSDFGRYNIPVSLLISSDDFPSKRRNFIIASLSIFCFWIDCNCGSLW